MTKTRTTPYDVAAYLTTPAKRAAYLEATLEEFQGDAQALMEALGDIARSEGMANVAKKSGLSRESLYKTLSGTRKPGFATILKIMTALGLQIQVVARP